MIDCNLIAYYTPEESIPYKRYESGAKDDNKADSKSTTKASPYPILTLEEDIILSSGCGLKKGFYSVKLSSNYDYLLLYMSGRLYARVPVIKLTTINSNPRVSFKKDKSWQFWHKKDHLGESSEDIIYAKSRLKFDSKTNSYLIFWEYGNTRAIGVISVRN